MEQEDGADLLGSLGVEDIEQPHLRGGVKRLARHGGGDPREEAHDALGE